MRTLRRLGLKRRDSMAYFTRRPPINASRSDSAVAWTMSVLYLNALPHSLVTW